MISQHSPLTLLALLTATCAVPTASNATAYQAKPFGRVYLLFSTLFWRNTNSSFSPRMFLCGLKTGLAKQHVFVDLSASLNLEFHPLKAMWTCLVLFQMHESHPRLGKWFVCSKGKICWYMSAGAVWSHKASSVHAMG
jgi:hypothetical protein